MLIVIPSLGRSMSDFGVTIPQKAFKFFSSFRILDTALLGRSLDGSCILPLLDLRSDLGKSAVAMRLSSWFDISPLGRRSGESFGTNGT